MVSIESLESSSSPKLLESARKLFLAYGGFLRASGEHYGFNFERLQQEALDLPASYVGANGGVLVAVAEESAVGCIAFRAFPSPDGPDCCQIKGLYVLSEYRGLGLGLRLTSAALEHARAKGYRFACLDTEPVMMASAHRTYLKLGFVEYERGDAGGKPVSFLRKSLT